MTPQTPAKTLRPRNPPTSSPSLTEETQHRNLHTYCYASKGFRTRCLIILETQIKKHSKPCRLRGELLIQLMNVYTQRTTS